MTLVSPKSRGLLAVLTFLLGYAFFVLLLFVVPWWFPTFFETLGVWFNTFPDVGVFALLFSMQTIALLIVLIGAFRVLFGQRKQLVSRIRDYFKQRTLRVSWSVLWRCLLGGLVLYLTISVLLTLLFTLLGVPLPGLNGEQVVFSILESMRLEGPIDYGILVIVVAFLAPLFEELIYRGLITDALMRAWGWWGVLAGAVLFAGIHMEPGVFVNLFILSCVLGYIYRKTKSLVYPFLFHVCINIFGLVAMFLT